MTVGEFVLAICSEKVQPSLMQCIMEMIARYLEIYKACMRGKKYAIFEQEWFQHIHEYMEEDSEQSGLWKMVVSRAKVAANKLDQRIVISTIAYHVHDLMTEKVKEFKRELSHSVEQSSQSSGSSSSSKFTESKINLLRYGGFALHSML